MSYGQKKRQGEQRSRCFLRIWLKVLCCLLFFPFFEDLRSSIGLEGLVVLSFMCLWICSAIFLWVLQYVLHDGPRIHWLVPETENHVQL